MHYPKFQTKAAYVLFYQRRDLAADPSPPACNGNSSSNGARINGDVEDMDTN